MQSNDSYSCLKGMFSPVNRSVKFTKGIHVLSNNISLESLKSTAQVTSHWPFNKFLYFNRIVHINSKPSCYTWVKMTPEALSHFDPTWPMDRRSLKTNLNNLLCFRNEALKMKKNTNKMCTFFQFYFIYKIESWSD